MLSGKRAIAGLVATGNLIVFYVAGAFLAPTENPRSAKGWNQCTIALFSFLSCTFALPLSLKTGSAPLPLTLTGSTNRYHITILLITVNLI